MSTQGAAHQLREMAIFEGLSEDEVRALLEGAERREVAAGAVIFKEGDAVDGLYLVESGKVSIRKAAGTGKLHDLAIVGAKHAFGEMGLLVGGRPRTATVVALEASILWRFPGERFSQLVGQGSPAMGKVVLNMARVLAHRLDAINRELVKVIESRGEKKKLAELAAFKDKLTKEWSF